MENIISKKDFDKIKSQCGKIAIIRGVPKGYNTNNEKPMSKSLGEIWDRVYATENDAQLVWNKINEKPTVNYLTLGKKNTDAVLNYIGGKSVTHPNLLSDWNAMEVAEVKSIFYQMFKHENFLPKIVFSADEVIQQNIFPVVAKVDTGHSGIGVMKFDDKKSFTNYLQNPNYKNDFKSFSQFINIKKEFRAICFQDKPLYFYERVNNSFENKILSHKSQNSKIKFCYVRQNSSLIPSHLMSFVNNCVSTIYKSVNLGIWALDFALDDKNNLFVFEINTRAGLDCCDVVEIYMKLFEILFEGEKICDEFRKYYFNKYIKSFHEEVYKKNKDDFKTSEWRIDYENLNWKTYNY